MENNYINEAHRKYSVACQKEVLEMMDNPLTAEEKEEQMNRNMETSALYSSGEVSIDKHIADPKNSSRNL